MSMTDRYRITAWILFIVTILAALAGWAFFDRDPSQLSPIIGWLTAAVGIGEGANVGKRATFKKDAVIVESAAR